MIDLLSKGILTEEDINQLISLNIEESIHLDFKQAGSLEKNDKKKAEIAKDVSAFANSDGGFIIYGIKEDKHVADSLSFVDGNEFTKEWIEQVIQTRIQPKIENLRVLPIRFDSDIKKSIYVVDIPASSLAPHMTSDKKFYRRYNFESVQMEEFEIRNLYNRKEKTKLIINDIIISKDNEIENEGEYDETILFYLGFQIENISNTIEKYYKLLIELNFTEYTIHWEGLKDSKLNHIVLHGKKRIISLTNPSPIFPGEVLSVGEFELGLRSSEIEELFKIGKLKLKLIYSNGTDEMEIKLKKLIKTNT